MRKYYMSELETGHIEANAQVAQSLFKQATNKEKPNVSAAIFWLKCRAEWREDGKEEMGKKEAREVLSKVAARGTDWEGLLQ
jgi:RNA polymerase-interacting CarD/CdnL/TRCF family regulator